MSDTSQIVIRGVAHWAKIIGAPRKNEYTGEREWSIDVTPDKEGLGTLRKLGIADRLRDPKPTDKRTEQFFSFRQREFRADGAPSEPIRVVNAEGEPWGNDLIGNGTKVDVKFVVKDYGKGKKKGVYIRAVRVLDLVPYIAKDFAPLDSDDEYFAAAASNAKAETVAPTSPTVQDALDELDDDVAF